MAHSSINHCGDRKRRIAIHFLPGGPSSILQSVFSSLPYNLILSLSFICGFDQCLSVLLILFPLPLYSVFLTGSSFTCYFLPHKLSSLMFFVLFCFVSCSEAGQWGWSLVFCVGELDLLCGYIALAVCIQACVCVPVQCCVQGTETCPDRWTTRGLFPIIPFTSVCYLYINPTLILCINVTSFQQ